MPSTRRTPPKASQKPAPKRRAQPGVFGTPGAEVRAAIYARVSTGAQTHDSQLGPLREYCQRRGWTVVAEVLDVASGAKQRPRRDALIAAARRRELDAVVCFKLDRWGRSTADLVTSLAELEACGCAFVSVTDAIDLTTPSGRALAGMLAVFAGFERDLIRERVSAGLDAARARGKRLGRPPLASATQDRIRVLSAAGASQRAIARELGIGVGSVSRALSGPR